MTVTSTATRNAKRTRANAKPDAVKPEEAKPEAVPTASEADTLTASSVASEAVPTASEGASEASSEEATETKPEETSEASSDATEAKPEASSEADTDAVVKRMRQYAASVPSVRDFVRRVKDAVSLQGVANAVADIFARLMAAYLASLIVARPDIVTVSLNASINLQDAPGNAKQRRAYLYHAIMGALNAAHPDVLVSVTASLTELRREANADGVLIAKGHDRASGVSGSPNARKSVSGMLKSLPDNVERAKQLAAKREARQQQYEDALIGAYVRQRDMATSVNADAKPEAKPEAVKPEATEAKPEETKPEAPISVSFSLKH